MTTAAEAVGEALRAEGVEDVFTVIGSGNFVVTQALHAAGASVHHARHENGAICMADAYARVSGRVGVCSVHQGPGLTNTLTGLTEAAKARTPLLVLAGEAPAAALRSNFRIDAWGVVERLGAVPERLLSPPDAVRAYRRAAVERRPVVLLMPLDVQTVPAGADSAATASGSTAPGPIPAPAPPVFIAPGPAPDAVARLADLVAGAERPVIVAGHGAVLADAREPLVALGEATGALLATSARGHGLFAGEPWSVGISGGFASPDAAEALRAADLWLSFGASLTRWTTRDGALIADGARVAQVDLDADALGAHRPVDVGVVGDAALTARALLQAIGDARVGFRGAPPELARWRDEPYDDRGGEGFIDPRTLSIALDDLLPAERTLVVDSGHFMGWPPMYMSVPDPAGFVFAQAYQSIGLGLGGAIGAAIARPERLTVAALGDGGALMALPELETLARLRLPLLVVVYDDAAYGAEVHHFGPMGMPTELVKFRDADIAAMARACGAAGVTVRAVDDLAAVGEWLQRRDGPLVADAKVVPDVVAGWLEEAFR
jgi:thiamine pyrophosphate-dependent acetolactate synthase large subunit-like protein